MFLHREWTMVPYEGAETGKILIFVTIKQNQKSL